MEEFLAFVGRVQALVPPFESLVLAFCFISGIVLIIRGIMIAARSDAGQMASLAYGDRSIAAIVLGHLVVGFLLIALPQTVMTSLATLFGDGEQVSPTMIFAYAPELLEPASTEAARKLIIALLYVVQFIGLVGLVRGLFLLNQAPQHPGSGLVGRGVTHLVGGALAMNIVVFVGMIESLVIG